MKVSKEGKLLDPQAEDGKKIVEAIYRILHKEWFPFMKEQFKGDDNEYFAIFLFWCLMLGDPSNEELTVILYAKETEYSPDGASWHRCEKIAGQILLLKPWVELNASYTDDPTLQ